MFSSEMGPSEPTSNSILFSQRSGECNWSGFTSTNSVIAQLRGCLYDSHYVDHWSRGLVLLEHSNQILNGINELAFAQSEHDVGKLTIESWLVEFSSTEAEPVVIVQSVEDIELDSSHILIDDSVVETNSSLLLLVVGEVDELPSALKWLGYLDILWDRGVSWFGIVGGEHKLTDIVLNVELSISEVGGIFVFSVLC